MDAAEDSLHFQKGNSHFNVFQQSCGIDLDTEMVSHELVTVLSLSVLTHTHTHTDGLSMWASVQKEPTSREPDYSSIEQLFCLPVTEDKDKGAAAPVKKEPKEVCLSNTQHAAQGRIALNVPSTLSKLNNIILSFLFFIDFFY